MHAALSSLVMFGKKKLKADIQELQEQIKKLEKDIGKLETFDYKLEIEKIKSQMISLRGLVNRKLSVVHGDPGEEELKSPDGLDSLRRK